MKQSLARALLVAVVAFDLAFVFPGWRPTRVLWYYPLAHRFALEAKPSSLAMDFYGRVLLAIGCALAAFAIAFLVGKWRRATPRSLSLWTAWAAIATALVLALQIFQLAPRMPTPEPLPSWYRPK